MTANTIDNDITMPGSEGALLAGRYRVVRQLGQGGMGSVWLAEDTQLDGKLFAIKMLPSILVSNKRAYSQLKAEALVSMRLTHTNIVTLRAFEENNGNPFLVMDYIDGQTIDDYLADRMADGGGGAPGVCARMLAHPSGSAFAESALRSKASSAHLPSESEVIRILKPIAEALDYAHREGVVHRDVKPANVMIRKDGHPFILDFGIAREIQETMTRVTGKLSSGTLLYMSPEQLNGDAPKAAQDVYSFAAMVYECLTGHPPFYRGAIEDQIKNKEPDPPAALSIAASVMAGLAKKPEDRPSTCAAVLAGGDGFNAEKQRCGGAEGSNGKFDRVEKGGAGRGEVVADRPEKSGGLGKALAGLLVLAAVGGAVWFATRTDDDAPALQQPLPPVVTNVVVRPPKPLPTSGPTEADVTEISVEASVQKGRIERIDDADGFKRRKNQLSDLLTEAVSYGKVKRWDKAAVCFTNYVDNCIALTELDRRRYEARDARTKSTSARKRAEAADSSKYASVGWNAALKIAADAVAAFDSMRFSDATRYYETAMKQFEMCADDAKKERQRQESVRLENERQAAGDARARALSASKRAEKAGAKKHAWRSWNAAAEKWKTADAELENKRFADAAAKFSELERMFDSSAREAERVDTRNLVKESEGVQLWKDGPYWATRNIGAEKPEDYGYYFWWGDTIGYKRVNDKWVASDGSTSDFSFGQDKTPTYGKDVSALQSEGWITEDGVLAPKHDAARAHLGGAWRMPTKQEFKDLKDKCDWKWMKMDGVNGYRICGKGAYASASIFLPAAGYGYGTLLSIAGSYGYYLSSVPYSDNIYAWHLYFSLGDHYVSGNFRYDGQSVRAVRGFTK